MKIVSKLNAIFKLNKVKDAEGAKVWMVSWDARYGEFYSEKERASKAFLNYEDAKAFAHSLKEAKKLLQYTEGINITIKEQE